MPGTCTESEVMQRISLPMLGGLVTTLLFPLVVLPACHVLVYR